VLRRRLWDGFIDSPKYNIDSGNDYGSIEESKDDENIQSSITSMKKSLASIENYLSERLTFGFNNVC
jgi:hypothetical protein